MANLNTAPNTSVTNPNESNEGTNDSNAFDSGAKSQFDPLGASGTELYAGYFSEEYLQQLRGKRGAKVFDEMRRSESQIQMLLNAVMNPIKAGVWEFEAADDAIVPDAELHKDLIEFIATEQIDWETHLHEALTFLIYGFSIFEIVNNVVFDHPKFGTFNGLRGLAYRSQKTIQRWIVDSGSGDLKSVEQWVLGDLALGKNSIMTMLADFLLVFTVQKEGDNYEGVSPLRAMYGAWFRKNLYLKIMAIGIEKNAIGIPLGTVPAGKNTKEQEDAFKEVLQNFTDHESAYLMIPEGWKVEILKNEFDPAKVKEVVLMENTEMINSMVANFLALGMNGGSGAFALGTDLSDFFLSGIQIYANIIAGVWNRKLIPNLIKLNFGEQQAYPKIKVSGINDKAGTELSEVIRNLTDVQAIKPDLVLEEKLRKLYSLPKVDLTTTREPLPKGVQPTVPPGTPGAQPPSPGAQLSERRLKLAETWKTTWKNSKADVKDVMQSGLTNVLEDLKGQIQRQYKSATPIARQGLGLRLSPKTAQYQKDLREALAKVANQALIDAKKKTPKAAKMKIKLAESFQLSAPKGGYFDALPDGTKRIVANQAALIVQSQAADINKVVSFQYTSSQAKSEDIDSILNDIDNAAGPTIDGSTSGGFSVDAAAGDAVSQVASQASLEWFFEPDVLDTIESFTFTNEDPISEICQELDGQTWAVGDPDLDTYTPPLHHNCKSRLEPNEKGAEGNPEINVGTPVSQSALDSITLCECNYHLDFKLVDPGSASKKV